MSFFVTFLTCRRNCLIEIVPKNANNSDISYILYSKELREKRKLRLEFGELLRISKYHLLARSCYTPQFTQKKSKIVANASKKTTKFTVRMKKMRLYVVTFFEGVDQIHSTRE